MALFDKLQNVAKSAAAGAGDMIEITKLNAKISEESRKIANFKTELGELCWKQFNNGVALSDEAADFCRLIASCKEQISLLEAQIADIKNESAAPAGPVIDADVVNVAPAANACTACGAEIAAGARFCPHCGAEQTAEKFCAGCGNKVAVNIRFCPNCGAGM